MKFSKLKPILIALVFLALVGLAYIALNSSYFLKQIRYLSYKPEVSQIQNNNSGIAREETGEPNQISIPSLGIIAPIVESAESNEQSFQEALQKGVVHYPGTADPGQPGNVYLFGHSSDFAFKAGNYKTVFALLPHIKAGAEITVSDSSGKIFPYTVIETFVAGPADIHLLDQDTGGQKILTLQTSYPIGTALKRYIVKAQLAE